MSEWSKEPHSKCGIRVSVSRVRIPHFPQYKKKSVCPSLLEQADFFLYCKDAVGRLWDYVEIPPVCPSLLEQADFFLYCKDAVGRLWDYVEIPPVCPSLLEQADFFLYCKEPSADFLPLAVLASSGVPDEPRGRMGCFGMLLSFVV